MINPFNLKRRKFLSTALLALLGGLNLAATRNPQDTLIESATNPSKQANARLGINLASIENYATELPFVDMFRMSNTWVSQRKKSKWGTGPALDLDEHGWVKSLEPDCFATAGICGIKGNHYPSGEYTVLFDGEGEISFQNAATNKSIVSKTTGRLVVKVDAAKGAFFLDIVKTNPQNYIRNIRVIMPGFESSYLVDPWHPLFLKRWAGVACIRLMDFMATNNSKQMLWSDRPTLNDANFTKKGVPLELMVDLANRLNADAWFCMPHLADDDYIKQFAQYVKAQLKPSLRAWVEYSNEVWNNGFKQTKYAYQMGQSMGLPRPTHEFYAHRALQIFNTWKTVYGGTQGLVRVLATQAANLASAENVLSYKNAAAQADVLAIAPYVTVNITPKNKGALAVSEVANWNIDQLFEHVFTAALPRAQKWMQQNKKVAEQHGLTLVAYEAGQHLVGALGTENNETIAKLLIEANAHPKMGEVYSQYLQAWSQIGGDLICAYNSVGKWSKWGSWSLLQYYDDSPASSPKFAATIKWAISRGQKMQL